MLYLQKGQNLQNLQQVSCFFLDIPKDTAMYMYMYGYVELLWFKIWHHPPPPPPPLYQGGGMNLRVRPRVNS